MLQLILNWLGGPVISAGIATNVIFTLSLQSRLQN